MDSRVEDVMTRDVVAVEVTAGYKEIISRMRQRHVSAVPVLDAAGRLAGVVSEADLLLKELGAQSLAGLLATGRRGEQAKAAGVTAADLMTTPPVTIGPHESVAVAARRMHDSRVKRLPVVDGSGHLAGIVSRVDVLSVFARPDGEISGEISALIAADPALDPAVLRVTVSSGIVTVTGQAPSRAAAVRLISALHHVEGVVDVRDRIATPAESGGQQSAATRERP